MRVLLVALLIGAVATVAAEASSGTLVATPRFVPAAGPVIAGPDRVAWITRRDDAVLDLWVSAPGAGPRRVQRFSGADGERLRSPRLMASADAVGLALRVTDRRGKTLQTLTYAGLFGAPLAPAATLPATPAAPLWPQHAVAVTRGCESAEIRMFALAAGAAVADDAAPRGDEPPCELRLRSPLRLDDDRLRVGISCAGFRIACTARVTVRAGQRVIARGVARYNHTTPPYAAARLRLRPSARRHLRATTRLRVTARIGDGSLAAAVTRQTIVQLPAARR